jgi:hypothetical protein
MRGKRPARTKLERDLRALNPWFLVGFAVFCLALGGVFAWLGWRQLHAPAVELVTLEATLEEAGFDQHGLLVKITGSPARLFVRYEPDRRALREAVERRLRPGSTVVLEVDGAAWAASQAPGAEAEPLVGLRGITVAGERILRSEEVARVQAGDARAWPYAVGGCVALAGLLGYLAIRRAPLLDAVTSALAPAEPLPLASLLALKAPFALHRDFGTRERLQLWLGSAVLGAFGLGALAQCALWVQEARQTAQVWEQGSSAEAEVVHAVVGRGSVREHRLVLAMARDGAVHELQSSYGVWFSDERVPERVEVRYLAQAPDHVVSEPAYRATRPLLGAALTLGALGLALVGGAAWFARMMARRLENVRLLANTGRLTYAALISLTQTSGQHPQLELVYQLSGQPPTRQTFAVDGAAPLIDGQRVVVAASPDLRTSYALRTDGYPFALALVGTLQMLRSGHLEPR